MCGVEAFDGYGEDGGVWGRRWEGDVETFEDAVFDKGCIVFYTGDDVEVEVSRWSGWGRGRRGFQEGV